MQVRIAFHLPAHRLQTPHKVQLTAQWGMLLECHPTAPTVNTHHRHCQCNCALDGGGSVISIYTLAFVRRLQLKVKFSKLHKFGDFCAGGSYNRLHRWRRDINDKTSFPLRPGEICERAYAAVPPKTWRWCSRAGASFPIRIEVGSAGGPLESCVCPDSTRTECRRESCDYLHTLQRDFCLAQALSMSGWVWVCVEKNYVCLYTKSVNSVSSRIMCLGIRKGKYRLK